MQRFALRVEVLGASPNISTYSGDPGVEERLTLRVYKAPGCIKLQFAVSVFNGLVMDAT